MVLAQDENTRQQLFDQGQIDLLRNVRTEYIDQVQSKIDSGEITLISGPQPRNQLHLLQQRRSGRRILKREHP